MYKKPPQPDDGETTHPKVTPPGAVGKPADVQIEQMVPFTPKRFFGQGELSKWYQFMLAL
jgi:hypothetical protein